MFKKIIKPRFLILFFLITSILAVLTASSGILISRAYAPIQSGYHLNKNDSVTYNASNPVSVNGSCYTMANSDTSRDFFVPASTTAEFNAYKSASTNLNMLVTQTCCSACGTLNCNPANWRCECQSAAQCGTDGWSGGAFACSGQQPIGAWTTVVGE